MASADRREREKMLRRQQIMNAAREVFAAKGFGRATMEQIAEKADYKPATLYLYFKNKQELYTSLTRELMERISGRFAAWAAQEGAPPLDKLAQLPDLMCEIYDYDPTVLVALFRLQASQGLQHLEPETIAELNGHARLAMGCMARVFGQAMAAGQLRPHHPNAMADSAWAIFTGMVLWEESKRHFDGRKQYLKPTLKLAIDLLIEGAAHK